jgi:hypothetical protein
MPQIAPCGRHVSVRKSSCSPQTAMMSALTRSRPPFSNTTRLPVSPSSRWPMSSVCCEIGCMPQRWLIGCLSSCLTLRGIAGRDGCTCPNGVGNCLEHNAFGNFDPTRSRASAPSGRRQRTSKLPKTLSVPAARPDWHARPWVSSFDRGEYHVSAGTHKAVLEAER